MKVVWINPRFLHYRVPVYKALNEMLNNNLTILYSAVRTPDDVKSLITKSLGERAVALEGERRLKFGGDYDFANMGFHIPYQPGLFRAISRAKPDIIITEGFFQWTPAAIWAKILRRIPIVVAYERTIHTERNAGKARTYYRKMVAKHVDAICCNGSLSKKYCTEVLGFPGKHVITGAMAADTDALSQILKNTAEKNIMTLERKLGLVRPIYLYVGRLIRLKGLQELLAAWKKLVKISPTIGSLLLVGDGPERSSLEQMVHEQGLANVVFARNVDYSKIVSYYALADVLVMPTLEDNWSLVVPEAMACSKPILCSKYNGCWPELINDGLNGYVFDPYDIDNLATLLKKCSDNREQLPVMGRESFDIVQNYTPQKAAESCLRACHIAHSHYNNR